MIELGSVDGDVSEAACAAYTKQVEHMTRLRLADVHGGLDKLVMKRQAVPTLQKKIVEVQSALRGHGFFPGATIDGICGYRTQSAIRLFQEYVRSVERLECLPDGRCGAKTLAHLERWTQQKLQMVWAPTINAWARTGSGSDEYNEWLSLLESVKQRYLAAPSRELQLVNAYTGTSDTRKVAQWDFTAAGNTHLVGIRRAEMRGKFDDIFVLLIKGLVFKFQGTTEPGASSNPAGPPFLVPGQHNYHFGWHQRSYLALRPQSTGVLIVRAGHDKQLDAADLNTGLEPNATINIHWGGKGMTRDVNSWSEGCQTINGSVYFNASDTLVSCAAFTATSPAEAKTNPKLTRGAYNVLLDLVTALGSDLPGSTVKYTLLPEEDLALSPTLAARLQQARATALGKA